MIDLKGKPFFLSDNDITWIQKTLSNMTLEEKAGQLFFLVGMMTDLESLKQTMEVIKAGGYMFREFHGRELQGIHRYLQDNASIPLLLSANVETGGNGSVAEGTNFGTQLQVAATDDETMAYRLGLVCAREGKAVGLNMAFAPVVDIDFNYQNPITNTRTFGSDPERVLRMSRAFMKGFHDTGMGVTLKHWPGDGVDNRDQHLVTTINSLSVQEWDNSYGKIYKSLIDEGANAVMASHIMLPAYSRLLRPGIRDEALMPSPLAPELNYKLLREKLGFNGLIVSDSTSMSGFTLAMKRELAVPMLIASGCDVFLFTIDTKEDLEFMISGIKKGIISQERLEEALMRILALKASLKLHEEKKNGTLVPREDALSIVGCKEHRQWAKECADKGVTLVKDTQNLLPLTPQKHRKILLHVLGDQETLLDKSSNFGELFAKLLTEKGFEIKKMFVKGMEDAWNEYVKPIHTRRAEYDLVAYFANMKTASNQTVVRIKWGEPLGYDAPKFIHDIPTLFVSVANPYHLQDVPRVKTFINGYSSNEFVVEAVVEKLLGKSSFKGINPIDPFCGHWEAKL